MADDGWLGGRQKIPFAGIVAIVIIVAVVAIFIKTQLTPFFPESKMTVEAGNIAGKGSSDSFAGEVNVPLEEQYFKEGKLHLGQNTIAFKVNIAKSILHVETQGKTTDIILEQRDNKLFTQFEDDIDHVQTLVTMNNLDPVVLTYVQMGKSAVPITVALRDSINHRAEFSVRGEAFIFELDTATEIVTIKHKTTEEIQLYRVGEKLEGTWIKGNSERHITVSKADGKLTAKIESIY